MRALANGVRRAPENADERATPSRFAAIREGDLNRFYTKQTVGDLLTAELSAFTPASVIDLGAGDGSLSAAVRKRWKDAQIVTVDIDPHCVPNLRQNVSTSDHALHCHYNFDVFDLHLTENLGRHGEFDLAVCNPPFFKPEWRRDFAHIFLAAGLEDALLSAADASAEAIFLAQNLRIVRDGGTVAMIAPDGMITGHRTKALRRAILSKHRIECVLQLPKFSFYDTEARCFVLIITKNEVSNSPIKLLRYQENIGVSNPIYIDGDDRGQRLDYDFHSTKTGASHQRTTLRKLGADVRRGSLSSVEARLAQFPIFHTSDYGSANSGRICLAASIPDDVRQKLVVGQAGDILIARVDRKLHEKVGLVVSGTAALSDCVYRVRLPKKFRELAFKALSSTKGMESLKASSKGVSARLLGKADLLDMPIDI